MANIAVNTRFLLKNKLEGFGWYTYEVAKRLVQNHPEHHFYFFFDRPFDESFIFGQNVTPVVLNPPARHPFLHYIWYEFSVRKALKKYKIDLFFSPDGYLSLKTKVPQVITIHDLNFEYYPQDLPFFARKYYKYFFPKFAKKASRILTVSNYSKGDIENLYQIDGKKIKAIWNGVSDIFVPLNDERKSEIKRRYGTGENYFLFVGSLHPRKNLQRLIDAYNAYSKTNLTPWSLVIVGEKMWKSQSELLSIPEECKMRIHFTGRLNASELSKVVASAGALTFVPYFEGFGIPMVEAMRCGVPVLAGDRTALPEIGGDAVIYCNPFDVQSIEKGLHQLSDNVKLRTELSQKGLQQASKFSWETCAEEVWRELEKSLQVKTYL